MAEAVGLATGIISLATLFSTCIECFNYYKSSKECPAQVEMKLVKLDFEKTRLLIWANEVGLVSTDAASRNPGIEANKDKLRAVLEQIQALLAEANRIQDYYGVVRRQQQHQTERTGRSTDLVSRNSLHTFVASYRRFCGKFPRPELTPRLSARVRWAICDGDKFECLIKDLKEFVEELYWWVPVDQRVRDNIVEQDIMATTDLVELAMIKDASDHDYEAWSDMASRAVDRTEKATTTYGDPHDNTLLDRDIFSLRDQPGSANDPTADKIISFYNSSGSSAPPLFFVLTDPCTSYSNSPPCLDENFGQRLANAEIDGHSHYRAVGSSNLGHRLVTKFGSGTWSREDIQKFMFNAIPQEYRSAKGRPSPFYGYIYVAPCERLIAQAVRICSEVRGIFSITIYVRVDDRLSVSCCLPGSEHPRLVSMFERFSKQVDESLHKLPPSTCCRCFLDTMWLEQRIHEIESEEQVPGPEGACSDGDGDGGDHHTTATSSIRHIFDPDKYSVWFIISAIVFVGEEAELREIMTCEPFPKNPHIPSATEIHAMFREKDSFSRKFLGRFPRNGRLARKNSLKPETSLPLMKKRKIDHISGGNSEGGIIADGVQERGTPKTPVSVPSPSR